jgi:hypothetical protein
VGYYPAGLTIAVDHPIHNIRVTLGSVVRSLILQLKQTYNLAPPLRLTDSPSPTMRRMARPEPSLMERSQEPSPRRSLWIVCLYTVSFTVKLLTNYTANENIVVISGRADNRIEQISFVIYNSTTGKYRIAGVRFWSSSIDSHLQTLIP